jgi:hypothetical protein
MEWMHSSGHILWTITPFSEVSRVLEALKQLAT